MPVETGRSDGEFTRHYRGGTHLGTALQWDCPACGVKHETATAPIEHGCSACGAGVPGTAGPPRSPAASAGTPSVPQPTRPEPGPPARAPERARPVSLAAPEGQQTVYRILRYSGSKAWIETTLRHSLVGYMDLGAGMITAAIVDSIDRRQEDLLGMATRQPGVWMGGPPDGPVRLRAGPDWRPENPTGGGERGVAPLASRLTSPVTSITETSPVPNLNPHPVVDLEEQKIADVLHQGVADVGCYTIAMALTQFATVVEDETMERDKYWSPQQCLGVANALLALIPKDWNPEPEPEITGEV